MFDDSSFARIARAALTGLAIAVSAIAWAAAPALAEEVFEVNGLRIDETAADELSAKFNGIANAQQVALNTVFRRLIARSDAGRLPKVDKKLLPTLVEAFDITNEKFGGGRYLATMSVRFIPDQVAKELRLAGIPFAMTRSRPLVILPIIDTGSGKRLWDDPNPWRRAWEARLPYPGLFSLIMPDGDLADVTTINVSQAFVGNAAAFRAIATKYRAAGVMVAVASVRGGGRTIYVSLRFIGGSRDGRVLERRYEGGGSTTQILNQVVGEVSRELENTWKSRNIVDFSREDRISVLVPIAGMGDWLAVRKRLSGMARVQSINVARMSREEAEIDLGFVGSTEQLRNALAQQGLELVYSPDHPLWLLRPGAGW